MLLGMGIIHNSKLFWLLQTILCAVELVWLANSPMHIQLTSLLLPSTLVIIMGGLSYLINQIRPRPRLVEFTNIFIQLTVSSTLIGILTYLVASTPSMLMDMQLATLDQSMGFNWLFLYKAIKNSFPVELFLDIFYFGMVFEIFFIVAILIYKRLFSRAQELVWLVTLSALLCTTISIIVPAAGAFAYYEVKSALPYTREYLSLHAGQLKTINLITMQGVVQFPSYHTCLALIYMYAVRGIPKIFLASMIFNVLVLVATPPIGGHHFIDVWAGFIVTIISIAATTVLTQRAKDKKAANKTNESSDSLS